MSRFDLWRILLVRYYSNVHAHNFLTKYRTVTGFRKTYKRFNLMRHMNQARSQVSYIFVRTQLNYGIIKNDLCFY